MKKRHKDILFIILITVIFALFCKTSARSQDKRDLKNYFANGIKFRSEGKYEKALKSFKHGLQLSLKLNHKQAESIFLGNIGLVYADMGDLKNAIKYSEMALEIARKTMDKREEGGWLLNIGAIYFDFGEYDKALKYFEDALPLVRIGSNRAKESLLMGHLGLSYSKKGNFKKAMEYFEKALELSGKAKYWQGKIAALEHMGDTYLQTGEYKKAIVSYKKKAEVARRIKDNRNTVLALIKMGSVYIKLGDYQLAEKHFRDALKIAKSEKLKEVAMGNMGSALVETGKYDEALKQYRSALVIARKINDRKNEGRWLGGIGNIHSHRGEYKKTLDYYEKSLSIAREIKDRQNEGIQLGNIGAVYLSLGEYNKALGYFRTALSISRDIRGKAAALENIGIAYTKKGEPRAALHYYEKALKIFKKIGDKHRQGVHLINIGNVYNYLGEFDEAMKCYERARVILEKVGDKKATSRILGNTGIIHLKQAEYDKALDCFTKALEIAEDIGDRSSIFVWFYNKGLTYRRMKKNKEAIENFKKAISVLEDLRGAIKIDELKSSFIKQYIDVYEMLIELLFQKGMYKEAFHYAERSKARNFLDALGNRRIVPRKAGDRELANKERELLARIRSMEKMKENLKGKELEALYDRIRSARDDYDKVLAKLIISNPDYASLITIKPAEIEEIQNLLSPDEIIIEYLTGENKTYVWTITRDEFTHHEVNKTSKDISNKVEFLRDEIILSPGTVIEEEDIEYCRKRLSGFYSVILKPVRNDIGERKNLVIVPHGSLHYVPFCALIDEDGKYIAERFSVLTEPSASAFALFRKRKKNRPDSFIGYALGNIGEKGNGNRRGGKEAHPVNGKSNHKLMTGKNKDKKNVEPLTGLTRSGYPPLPGSKEEVEMIGKILRKREIPFTCFIENKFTVETARKSAPSGGYVHFSTHGFLSPRAKGRFSGIVASDGYIYIMDIFNWNLNADMVVLSACKTGLGKLLKGDDMVCLPRAFIQAGADNLVATLWSVQDESTRDLMVEFYKRILSGESKSGAMRNAQLKIMKKYKHPYFWAPFVLFGKGN
ncbi:MAG: tetratricopeptide repeat protein [Candidatus Eremiobacteraeota bacterium]|nr:tetratricopeptide repeat protein [Candidatus Eremiobacteraeota bacterium]